MEMEVQALVKMGFLEMRQVVAVVVKEEIIQLEEQEEMVE